MTILVERALVKDILQIPRADTVADYLLSALIEQASDEAEDYCRRKFLKKERVETFRSYEQAGWDPEPQYIWLDGPVDMSQPFIVSWQDTANYSRNGNDISAGKYDLDPEKALLKIRGDTSELLSRLPIPRGSYFGNSPAGFVVRYTGGYPITVASPNSTPDPLDDYGVVQVPKGLKMAIAQKVARDFQTSRTLLPWTDEEHTRLKAWKKKDII